MRNVGRVNRWLAVGAVASLTLAACTSKSTNSSETPSGSASTSANASTAPSTVAASSPPTTSSPPATSSAPASGLSSEDLNNSGTPVVGGTLHMLGVGDVDYMDPNISYYSAGYTTLRLWSRQLVTFPAVAGKTTTDVPDLATQLPTQANGGISADGLTYKLTITKGDMWNTTPVRQVTAADVVRGVKRTCNPAHPFGGEPDFESLIAGLQTFCDGFAKVDASSASAIAAYQNSTDLPGVSVDPTDPDTVVFKLTQPASYFLAMLALSAFSPSPAEYDAYVPASAQLATHTISDGPYEVTSYTAGKQIDLSRNPTWSASTDNVRKAYVDKVVITTSGDQTAIQQELQANTAGADMEFDTFPPVSAVNGLLAKKDPNLYLGPEFASNPYLIFNYVSPNNGGALGKLAVRKALEEAINRANLIQDDNGPIISPPLTHVLPAGISGTTSNTSIDLYPYDAAKAKADLATAGYPNGLTLKFLYRPKSSLSLKAFTTLQQDLAMAGIKLVGVGVPNADFYTKYLQVPSVAKAGTWDLSLAGWGPDWYGDAALSFFGPLFATAAFPPAGSNYGFYSNPAVDKLITQASAEQDPSKSSALWVQADKQVMEDAGFFPILSPNTPTYHASHVHNTVFIPALQQIDPANVWLTGS
jgi:peptide/nickel transport system substrate-binding protein